MDEAVVLLLVSLVAMTEVSKGLGATSSLSERRA